ncbi:lysophospholipid acyltransferase family protein [Yoonia litorea]|uniref:Uncharacterized protein n=1 Tax=Yoonia litorea TaxID=1123755 RepID=A0A1I6N2L4_9RHOB|nr:DUF374 domain-containing protein [Yoonia litorea]SFS22127.1 hypothetical protein SAMN05444714_3150 [Yoonia litorea]
MKSVRRRLEKSERLAAGVAGLAGRYLAFCDRTTKWQTTGLDTLKDALSSGPVILVMWHERSIMGALHWPVAAGPLSSLYANSPIGRVSGALQRSVGLQPMQMSDKTSNVVASRQILKRVKDGVSIGLTGDGPLGPALVLKDAPLEWARVTGVPVFTYAFATSRFRRLDAWDKMIVPKPFGLGAIVFRRFETTVPRRMDEASREEVRSKLSTFLTETNEIADQHVSQLLKNP